LRLTVTSRIGRAVFALFAGVDFGAIDDDVARSGDGEFSEKIPKRSFSLG
jgi:hypothetical protein